MNLEPIKQRLATFRVCPDGNYYTKPVTKEQILDDMDDLIREVERLGTENKELNAEAAHNEQVIRDMAREG